MCIKNINILYKTNILTQMHSNYIFFYQFVPILNQFLLFIVKKRQVNILNFPLITITIKICFNFYRNLDISIATVPFLKLYFAICKNVAVFTRMFRKEVC